VTYSKNSAKHKKHRAIERDKRSSAAAWRSLPATELQWAVLRRIEAASGVRFDGAITRGEASDRIGERFATDDDARRAGRRARRARRRDAGAAAA